MSDKLHDDNMRMLAERAAERKSAAPDRDDLAAILAKHEWCKYGVPSQPPRWWPMCSCGESFRNLRYDQAFKAHRAHVAQMVLESDWLRDVKADVWKEARMAVLSGFVPESEHEFLSLYPNPYCADNTTDRT